MSLELDRALRVQEAVDVTMVTPRIIWGMFFGLLIMCVQIGPQFLLGWLGIPVACIAIMQTLAARSYLKLRHRSRPEDVSMRRVQSFFVFALLMGLAWGALLAGLILEGHRGMQIIATVFAFFGGLAVVSISSLRVVFGFAPPSMLMAWIAVIWTGLIGWFAASMLFGFGLVLVYQFAMQARKQSIASIELSLENARAMKERFEAGEQLHLAQIEVAKAEQERAAEAALTQRNLINAVAFPMVLSEGNQGLEVTPAGRAQFRVPAGPLDSILLSDFFPDPQDQMRIIAQLDETGVVDNYEVMMQDLEGNQFWCVVSMRPLKYDGRDCWLNSIYVIDARKRMETDLAASKDAAEAMLAELKSTQASLVHAEKMASLGQLTAGIAHEIKNPLNFVNNFSKLSADMLDELVEILAAPIATLETEERADAEDLIDTVRGNLLKIDEHGKRADSIVKNMLLHSREGSGEKLMTNLNDLAKEAMNLAYHGARASDPAFNIDLADDMSSDVGEVECLPQDLQRVILNLCSNGMYEAVKQAKASGEPPKLKISSRKDKNSYVIDVTDNGGGIPDDIKDKVFQPFFTTKPTGEGTGLGLSMSFDIIKQHGGELSLESEVGKGSTFRVKLPAPPSAPTGENQS